MKAGGCGLRRPTIIRPAARIAALATIYAKGAASVGPPLYAQALDLDWVAAPLQDLRSLLGPNADPLAEWLQNPATIKYATGDSLKHKWWSDTIGKSAANQLLDTVPPRDQARLLEQSSGIENCLMAVTPSNQLHTSINSATYRLGLKWWLGIPIVTGSNATCPGCSAPVDIWRDHLLLCPRINYAKRHNAVQEALACVLDDSGQGYSREVALPQAGLRPADLMLRTFQDGKDTAVDLTISHGWQVAERSDSISREKWRSFLKRKEHAKQLKYSIPCADAGWEFLPMAFGTWGGLGPSCAKLLHRLVKRAAGWYEGTRKAARQDELRHTVGLALSRQVWCLLEDKAFVQTDSCT